MTPQTLPHGTRMRLLALTVCAVVWCCGSECWAGCGSYLLPPVMMAEHEQLPEELRAGKLYGRHNEAPCRGPRCQSRPQQDLPVPTAPAFTPALPDFAACPVMASYLARPPRIIAKVMAGDELVASTSGTRLERPPRA